ncbi:MAG: hypothetical protein IKV69_02820 [Clostridia bacterium]|nr:hypothetical protein [Clostridia bacterium]
MKKFFALVFVCFVFFVASFSNVFFEKLVGLEGGIEVSFYCTQKNDGDVFSEVKNGDGYVYTAQIENLVVDAWVKKSKQQVIQAVSYDPLCSAVLSLEEIKEMCEELFKVNKDYLGDFY